MLGSWNLHFSLPGIARLGITQGVVVAVRTPVR